MIIGIDGNEASITERVGVNVWAFELLRALKGEIEKSREYIDVTVYLSKSPRKDLPQESARWHYRVIGPPGFWTRWRLPLDLYMHLPKPDVFLSLSHYAPKWAPMPRIVSIMDLSFLHFPEAFKPLVRWQLEHWTRESMRQAARVLTISEFTKREIVRVYGYPEEKITVVYPGISETIQAYKGQTLNSQGLTFKRYGVRGKYLLFVGTLQPKKNLPRLIEAFQLIQKDFPETQLVIAGKIWRQFSSEKYQILSDLKVSDTFNTFNHRFLGFVPDVDLPPLIAGAECLVLPSLYEGFGIPALEAMALGTPVAASNTTSIPEVVNGCGAFFDPTSVSDIARGIHEVLSWSPAKRQEMVEKGMIRAEKFSWEKSAEEILRVLD